MPSSRPPSARAAHVTSSASSPRTPAGPLPPTLSEILSNLSPPPWTLSAFMAYLSTNHCLETLEFTMEAERYKSDYLQRSASTSSSPYLCSLWAKLMHAYIVPCAPREVNLPSPVRDRLLNLGCSPVAPDPSELDEAVGIVYELMNDSVLVPFLESVNPSHWEYDMDTQPSTFDEQRSRSRSRTRSSNDRSSKYNGSSSRSPKFLPAVLGGRNTRSASASAEAVDRAGLTDDSSGSMSPPPTDPMTPPTTPPTTEWAFTTSPSTMNGSGFQRAISAHNHGWKRMGAKLGFKKSKNGHRSTSSRPDGDVVMGELSDGYR